MQRHRAVCLAAFIVSATVLSGAETPFTRGSLILDTVPSVGLVPSMKFGTITLFDPDTSFRTLLYYEAFTDASRIHFPAFDRRCTLQAIRVDHGNYELVEIGADGIVAPRFRIVLPSTPSQLFVDQHDVYYVSLLPMRGITFPWDLALFDAGGTKLAEIDLPDTNGIKGFDLAANGCELVYATDLGDVQSYDMCRQANGTLLPFAGLATDVRFLPNDELLVNAVRAIERVDAAGNVIQVFTDPVWGGVLRGIAVAPDGRSFWTATYSLYHFSFDAKQTPIVNGAWIPWAISVSAMTVCGDWRAAPPRRRSAHP